PVLLQQPRPRRRLVPGEDVLGAEFTEREIFQVGRGRTPELEGVPPLSQPADVPVQGALAAPARQVVPDRDLEGSVHVVRRGCSYRSSTRPPRRRPPGTDRSWSGGPVCAGRTK